MQGVRAKQSSEEAVLSSSSSTYSQSKRKRDSLAESTEATTRKPAEIRSKKAKYDMADETVTTSEASSEVKQLPFTEQDINQMSLKELETHTEILRSELQDLFVIRGWLERFGCMRDLVNGWPGTYDRFEWGDSIRYTATQFSGWAADFAIGTKELEEEGMSKEDKQRIITSLKGFCVQEDFDSIVERLPETISSRIPSFFVQMFLMKDVFRRFFDNPFYYLQVEPVDGQGEMPIGAHLYALYKKFHQTHPTLVHQWRSATIRLASSENRLQAPNTEFGLQNRERRKAAVRSAVSEVLADETLNLLLKKMKPESSQDLISRRYDVLVQGYECAADLANDIYAYPLYPTFLYLEHLDRTFYCYSKTLDPTFLHYCFEEDETRLDSHKVLAILNPAMLLDGEFEIHLEGQVMGKAEVLIESEDYDPTETWIKNLLDKQSTAR